MKTKNNTDNRVLTPKEKAQELVEWYLQLVDDFNNTANTAKENAQLCALKAVDGTLNTLQWPPVESTFEPRATYNATLDYWQQVKTEIENL